MTTTKRCRRGKREDKPRVLPVGWRRSEGGGGWIPPPNLIPQMRRKR
jgi:hypothetical protein